MTPQAVDEAAVTTQETESVDVDTSPDEEEDELPHYDANEPIILYYGTWSDDNPHGKGHMIYDDSSVSNMQNGISLCESRFILVHCVTGREMAKAHTRFRMEMS